MHIKGNTFIMIEIFKAGLVGGILMDLWSTLVRGLGLTRVNIPFYRASMISVAPRHLLSGVSSLFLHLATSIAIAYAYVWVFKTFSIEPSIIAGGFLGLMQAIISGFLAPYCDSVNACVKARKVVPLRQFASGYGIDGVVAYMLRYVLYGSAIGFILSIA